MMNLWGRALVYDESNNVTRIHDDYTLLRYHWLLELSILFNSNNWFFSSYGSQASILIKVEVKVPKASFGRWASLIEKEEQVASSTRTPSAATTKNWDALEKVIINRYSFYWVFYRLL